MKLRDIFTEAFWKARWKETLEGFAMYGRAATGQPPFDMTPDSAAEQKKAEAKPAPKTPDAPKP